jgi:peroxiredoxin
MSLTPSTMIQLGTQAPDFALPDVRTGKTVSLSDFSDRQSLLVVFMCAHCPYVKLVEKQLASIGSDYTRLGMGMVTISANDADAYPDDAPQKLKEQADRLNFVFPYLYDETQQTARDYEAACTPDLFLFDAERRLVYRGQLDDARPGNGRPVTGKNLRAAISAILSGLPPSGAQQPATGCNIKWKPGHAPESSNRAVSDEKGARSAEV